jgi:hypothetical protein
MLAVSVAVKLAVCSSPAAQPLRDLEPARALLTSSPCCLAAHDSRSLLRVARCHIRRQLWGLQAQSIIVDTHPLTPQRLEN